MDTLSSFSVVLYLLSWSTSSRGVALDEIGKTVTTLTKQMMMTDQVQADCPSGIKSVRSQRSGTRPYHTEWHNSFKVMTIHNHADHLQVVGLGEFVACLNGVEFRTRHNDYELVRPKTNDKTYNAVEDLPFPPVPPQVLKQAGVRAQRLEMQKCFKAWRDQDPKVCDYRKYFRPLLCYLEGAWTVTNDSKIDEPFASDRHFINALSWDELHAKTRYSGFTGYKDNKENFAFLPTKIESLYKNPRKADLLQWNYRILCHPLKYHLPLSKLRLVDNLMDRVDMSFPLDRLIKSNGARFTIDYASSDSKSSKAKPVTYSLLDKLMGEIPGKDNYGAFIPDNPCNGQSLDFTTGKGINAAYYHRWYKVNSQSAGPNGQTEIHRSFNDPHMFMAKTTNPKVAAVRVKCGCDSSGKCSYDKEERLTYAFPLEIIYLTPLSRWNPYGIEYKGSVRSAKGKTVTENGRNGSKVNKNRAYNGINSRLFYQTPANFFGGTEINKDAADTVTDSVGVLNKRGHMVQAAPSGIRIFFPEISGVGILRQRYPIAPLSADAFGTYKEIIALRDAILNKQLFPYILPKTSTSTTGGQNKPVTRKSTNPTKAPPKTTNIPIPKIRLSRVKNSRNNGMHFHVVNLSKAQLATLFASDRNTVTVKTGPGDDGHTHTLVLRHRTVDDKYKYLSCDNGRSQCFGNHYPLLIDCKYFKTRPECI